MSITPDAGPMQRSSSLRWKMRGWSGSSDYLPMPDKRPTTKQLDPFLLMRCAVVLIVATASLALLGYNRLAAATAKPISRKGSQHYARWLGRHFHFAGRFIPFANCLPQAVALRWLLARSGHRSNIIVGVRLKSGGPVSAHAWVNCNGVCVLGNADGSVSAYRQLADLG
ncbi:lasso peptide biosynthesis B2 protein [Qipengyuania seohaensis]|uniref:lasso peptide biosynthesis B2 protein n=1 Tax=Qipengyuania seohaensis TaxID=266951 RepID=UPI000C221B4F